MNLCTVFWSLMRIELLQIQITSQKTEVLPPPQTGLWLGGES